MSNRFRSVRSFRFSQEQRPDQRFFYRLATETLNKNPPGTLSQGGKLLSVMRIRKHKPGHPTTGSGTDRLGVGRDYVEEVQRHAAELSEAVETNRDNDSGGDFADHRQQKIQQQMARLRKEALRARRLAEQIHNLPQDGTAKKRNPVMNDSSLVEPGRARRVSDKPRASGSQSSFNPLHPSMELPPEQLIRLLGLEGKKTRKHPKRAATAGGTTAPAKEMSPPKELAPEASPVSTWSLPDDMVPASRKRATKSANSGGNPTPRKPRRAHASDTVFQEHRNGLLLPAATIGVLAGLAVAAYLFWGRPSSEKTAVGKPPVAARIDSPKETTVTGVTSPPTQSKSSPIERKQPEVVNDSKWRAAVQAQEQRVRAAAQERLRARMQAAQYSAEETIGVVQPTVPPDTIQALPVPPPPADGAPPTTMDPDVVSAEPLPEPVEQPSAATTNAPTTRQDIPAQAEILSSPEPENDAPAALQPPVDMGTAPDGPETLEFAPAVENGVAQPTENTESPGEGVGDHPQANAPEAVDPASF